MENELVKEKIPKRKASLTSLERQVMFVLGQGKPGPVKRSQNLLTHDEIDWAKCFICEKENNKEKFQSSMDAISANAKPSYNNLADSIYKFQETGKLAVNIQVDKLECGKTLGESLCQNKAKYHKSCNLKFG